MPYSREKTAVYVYNRPFIDTLSCDPEHAADKENHAATQTLSKVRATFLFFLSLIHCICTETANAEPCRKKGARENRCGAVLGAGNAGRKISALPSTVPGVFFTEIECA